MSKKSNNSRNGSGNGNGTQNNILIALSAIASIGFISFTAYICYTYKQQTSSQQDAIFVIIVILGEMIISSLLVVFIAKKRWVAALVSTLMIPLLIGYTVPIELGYFSQSNENNLNDKSIKIEKYSHYEGILADLRARQKRLIKLRAYKKAERMQSEINKYEKKVDDNKVPKVKDPTSKFLQELTGIKQEHIVLTIIVIKIAILAIGRHLFPFSTIWLIMNRPRRVGGDGDGEPDGNEEDKEGKGRKGLGSEGGQQTDRVKNKPNLVVVKSAGKSVGKDLANKRAIEDCIKMFMKEYTQTMSKEELRDAKKTELPTTKDIFNAWCQINKFDNRSGKLFCNFYSVLPTIHGMIGTTTKRGKGWNVKWKENIVKEKGAEAK